jgi:Ca2+-binding EF-hand superfamily protein
VRALAALFRELDADGSGGVSAAELAAGLARLGYDVSGAEAAQLLEGADANRDGALQVRAGGVGRGCFECTPSWRGAGGVGRGRFECTPSPPIRLAFCAPIPTIYLTSSFSPPTAHPVHRHQPKQLPEFVAGLVDWSALQADARWPRWVERAFARLDADGDGSISLSELGALLGPPAADTDSDGEAERLLGARRMLREGDADGDGRVSRAEFAALLSSGGAGALPDGLAQYDARRRGRGAARASWDAGSDEEMAAGS